MLFGWGLGLAVQLVNALMPDREEKQNKDKRRRAKERRKREREQRRARKAGRRIDIEDIDGEKLEHAVTHFIKTSTPLRFEENKSLGDALLKAAKATGEQLQREAGNEAQAVEEAEAVDEIEERRARR